jgi:hypothetical protein
MDIYAAQGVSGRGRHRPHRYRTQDGVSLEQEATLPLLGRASLQGPLWRDRQFESLLGVYTWQ